MLSNSVKVHTHISVSQDAHLRVISHHVHLLIHGYLSYLILQDDLYSPEETISITIDFSPPPLVYLPFLRVSMSFDLGLLNLQSSWQH